MIQHGLLSPDLPIFTQIGLFWAYFWLFFAPYEKINKYNFLNYIHMDRARQDGHFGTKCLHVGPFSAIPELFYG